MKRILFRTDGNEIIASGHIRRCLSIAEALRQAGFEASWLFSDARNEALFSSLAPSGFSTRILPEGMAETDAIASLVRENEISLVFLDSYAFDEAYYKMLREALPKSCKTASFDDLCAFDPAVDLLINYDPDPPKELYHAPVQLLGPAYAPLRPGFSESAFVLRPTSERIFLSSGGTDPHRTLSGVLSQLYEAGERRSLSSLQSEVVMGSLFSEEYKEELRALSKRYPRISLHENVQDMAGLMKSCDLALSAGGTTVYELCALGIPTVVFSMADNQLLFTRELHSAGALWYECDVRNNPRAAELLGSRLSITMHDARLRDTMHRNARRLVDGKGCERIAAAIGELLS